MSPTAPTSLSVPPSPSLSWKTYGSVGLALVLLFGLGSVAGWIVGRNQAPPPQVQTETSGPAWSAETLRRLEAELALSPAEMEAIRPACTALESEVDLEKQRATFRTAFKVYQFHDKIAPSLKPHQQAQLKESKMKLYRWMKHRFEPFFRENKDFEP